MDVPVAFFVVIGAVFLICSLLVWYVFSYSEYAIGESDDTTDGESHESPSGVVRKDP